MIVTGPNSSRQESSASAGTSSRTVGASHHPGRSTRSPPTTTDAPSSERSIRSRLSSLITGPAWYVLAPATNRSRNSSYTLSNTTIRLAAAQRCPAFENADASDHSTARSRSASSQTTSAFLPPSSSTTFASLRPPLSAIHRPVSAEPVKLTRSTSPDSTSGGPASGPSPWTTLSTPGGSSSLHSSPKNAADAGVCSDGFSTAALPQNTAGKAFQA